MSNLNRRQLLGLGAATAAGAAGVAVAEASGLTTFRESGAEAAVAPGRPVAFYGSSQAGIASAVQDRLHMAAFDLTTTRRADVVTLLRAWTAAAARMTQGQAAGPGGAIPAVPQSPPDDTGEAIGLPASRLTITFGFGPTLFETGGTGGRGATGGTGGTDRFGLRGRRPAQLIDLPHFPGDKLDPARSGGDLVVQACADDPQVAVHAIRNLARIGFGTVAVRWSQLGFGKTSSTTPDAQTPRNLFGFKDGTNNIAGDDAAALARHVWADASDGQAWMAGGTYLVARRIRMHVETWDRSPLDDQEQITGRHKLSGAPLGLARERDAVKVASLPPDSHVALAHPDANGGHRILRRGYSFVDGSDGLGRLDAGLFFVAFCRDPRTQYVPLQNRLSGMDSMQEYLQHTGSGLWAVPPGLRAGGYVGQQLLEA